jgi:hypothetical protein
MKVLDVFWGFPLSGNLVCLAIMFLFDSLLMSSRINVKKEARWFAVHAFSNVLVVSESSFSFYLLLSACVAIDLFD